MASNRDADTPLAPRGPVRDAIVAAVDELARTRGWDATRMADVAAAAGVSRQTVYNEFGSRHELVQAYVLREIETLVAEVEAHVLANSGDAHEALRGAFGLFLKLASDEPVVRLIVNGAGGAELVSVLTASGLAVSTDRVGALIVRGWPQVAASDARLLAAAMARLAISHALLPTASPEEAAQEVTRLVGPFVEDLLR